MPASSTHHPPFLSHLIATVEGHRPDESRPVHTLQDRFGKETARRAVDAFCGDRSHLPPEATA